MTLPRVSFFFIVVVVSVSLICRCDGITEKEKTLAIIKPDGMSGNYSDKIKNAILDSGFTILKEMTIQLDEDAAMGFYAEHASRSFFSSLVKYMTSGPVLIMVLEKENAVADWRALIGPTDARYTVNSHSFFRKPKTFHSTFTRPRRRYWQMGCKINNSNPPILWKIPTKQQRPRTKTISFSSTTTDSQTQYQNSKLYTVKFKTLSACKLGIARYPDFEYNAEGGGGTGSGTTGSSNSSGEVSVSFDIETLYIPPLQTSTTKFLGLPLPPFLKIDIVPELFRGSINQESGKVDLEFKAKFWFSVGSIYRAPPLVVETVLTSEESKGTMRSGKGERLDELGNCKLVGVATVDPIDDFFINTFLGLPTECLAGMNAIISLSTS